MDGIKGKIAVAIGIIVFILFLYGASAFITKFASLIALSIFNA